MSTKVKTKLFLKHLVYIFQLSPEDSQNIAKEHGAVIISKLHGDKNLNSSPNKIIIVILNNKKIHWKFGKLHNKTIKMLLSDARM